MSRFNNVISCAAALLLAAACTPSAKIDGEIASLPSSEVIVKLLDVNHFEVLDTLSTDASGRFSCKVDIEKGQPEFIYIYYRDKKIASLLLEAGDKVQVEADTLGMYTVEGSEESAKLAGVERDHFLVQQRLQEMILRLQGADAAEEEEIRKEIGKEYVDYYRKCVRYVLANSRSLTVVPVLYQTLGNGLNVFAQNTDAIHFVNLSDSLALVYPDSKYVRALKKEAERRYGYLEFEAKLNSAEAVGYPDIVLPDINAEKIKLSEVDADVIMLYFWSASDAGQKMFNLDVLKSLYEDYHSKGFEIYQVALDADKASWAQVVKQQNLPWINVCDGLGVNSQYVVTYNLTSLPALYIIADGTLVDGQVVDEKSLRKLLDSLTR